MVRSALIGAVVLAAAACAPGARDVTLDPAALIRQASLVLLPARCAGVVIGDGARALTATHCLDPGERQVEVELASGMRFSANVGAADAASDLAVLVFARPLPVRPLHVLSQPIGPGEPVLFLGRPDRATDLQLAQVERVGRCPSLPDVPDALFTSIEGRRGDSGAPLVDSAMRVVGLVHGGAACSIAAPTKDASELIAEADGQRRVRHARRPLRATPPR